MTRSNISCTYMKSMVRRRMAPLFPKRAVAVAGGTRPWLASSAVRGRPSASDPRPNDVARENGTANQTSPPSK